MNYPAELPTYIKTLHQLYNSSEDDYLSQHQTTEVLNKLVSKELSGIWEILEKSGSREDLYWLSFISACEKAFFWSGRESTKHGSISDNKKEIVKTVEILKRLITGTVQNNEIKVIHLLPDHGVVLLKDTLNTSIEMTPNLKDMAKNGAVVQQQTAYVNTPLSDGLDKLIEFVLSQNNTGIKKDKGRAHFNHFKRVMTEFFNKKHNTPMNSVVAILATVILGEEYTAAEVRGKE